MYLTMNTKPKTIFIVDDEPLLTKMLQDDLSEHFPHVNLQSFATGEQAIKALGANPDIVILDYYLNSRKADAANGLDILKQLKQINRDITIIMLSSQTNYGTAAQTIANGAIHYVMKGKKAFEEIQQLVKANL